MSWIALWSHGQKIHQPPVASRTSLAQLTLVLELTLPEPPKMPARLSGPSVANVVPRRLWQGASQDGGEIAVYVMPDGAIRLRHRGVDLSTAAEMLRPGETLGLRYSTCARGRGDVFEVINHDHAKCEIQRSAEPIAARLSDALPARDGFLQVAHIAVISDQATGGEELPGLAQGTRVMTVTGPRRVETLSEGDLLIDDQGKSHPLLWIAQTDRLCLGRRGAVRLRAPYFGLNADLVVTSETRLVHEGPVIEYLYGTDRVLARTCDLTNGKSVQLDVTQPVRRMFHLLLEYPVCILAENAKVETLRLSDLRAFDGAFGSTGHSEADGGDKVPVLDKAGARALVSAHSRAA